MDIIKKYKWYILPLAILVIVVAIVTTQPSKKTKEVKNKPTTVTKVSKHSSHSSSKEKPSETSQTQEQPTQSEQATSTQGNGLTPPQDTLQQAQEQSGYTVAYLQTHPRLRVSKVRMRHVNNGIMTKLNGVFSKAILTQTVAQKRQTKTPL
jgi:hypothetical protein